MAIQSTAEIRRAFLEYFRERGHTIVPSSPLVPANDPTLLFTNAGMVQFKELFLGHEQRSYTRAASCQSCVRAGGKHNDLENVGYTARHHTLFEMLGNFSFGDYFKREAISYAWDFLTQVLRLDPKRLWITIYEDDEDAADIWLNDIGIDAQRFSRCGEKDNFWTMGNTGPCGPCSEIFYDHGPGIAGGPPGSPEADGDRFVEIWNLVFTQFDRAESGELRTIPHPSVDTGMGLERIAAVLQGVHNNYDTDLFRSLTGAVIGMLPPGAKGDRAAVQVIADHIRSCSFIVAEGVVPSNEGRGYVLRRIIRRAVRFGNKLGLEGPFFHRLVAPLVQEMGTAYPRIAETRAVIEKVLKQEELRFAETLEQGLKLLEKSIAAMTGSVIPGKDIFALYDTFGFPVELTTDIAKERGLALDLAGFEREMSGQRERARAASGFSGGSGQHLAGVEGLSASLFSGYDATRDKAQVVALLRDGTAVTEITAGEQAIVVLDRTPFYAESGGQVGDTGELKSGNAMFHVAETQKQNGVHLHMGTLKLGKLKCGDTVQAQVDSRLRLATALNHSATHLLHAALRKTLGEHVLQKGSLVAPDRLRFDFAHTGALSATELQSVEHMVNVEIRQNHPVAIKVMPMQAAIESGAMALFGEKYGDEVRVLKMGEFSVELCGGTHVERTGDIGLFKITSESGVAAGVRRIEAVTGAAAMEWVDESEYRLRHVADLLKANRGNVVAKVTQVLERTRLLEKELQAIRGRLSSHRGADLSAGAHQVDDINVVAEVLEGADVEALRAAVDQLKNKLGTAAIVLAAVDGQKVTLVAGVTQNAVGRVKAGELVNHVAGQVGGKGGGRPDMAQAGGNDPARLAPALNSVPDWIRARLAAK